MSSWRRAGSRRSLISLWLYLWIAHGIRNRAASPKVSGFLINSFHWLTYRNELWFPRLQRCDRSNIWHRVFTNLFLTAAAMLQSKPKRRDSRILEVSVVFYTKLLPKKLSLPSKLFKALKTEIKWMEISNISWISMNEGKLLFKALIATPMLIIIRRFRQGMLVAYVDHRIFF